MKTREEEINRAYYTEKKRYESEMLHRKSFERGALWADEHPISGEQIAA